jgi:hypothetical protein
MAWSSSYATPYDLSKNNVNMSQPIFGPSLNLKTAVECEKAVQAIDVHREWKNCVVTFWVMSQFLHFLGASRDCADFRDPTAAFRLNAPQSKKPLHSSAMPRVFLNRSVQI